jgi:SAM-dependent methyltransferase
MYFESNGAQTYFNRVPQEWDALYSHENRVGYAINKLIRSGIYDRYRLCFEHSGPIDGASVLDLGCGTGRFSVEFAKRGAATVVGVDFAPSMVTFSDQAARDLGVADTCHFACGDVTKLPFKKPFDIVIAMGLFDYLPEADRPFQEIASLTGRTFMADFPNFGLIGRAHRKVRYEWIRHCPIYYYTPDRLLELFRSAGFDQFAIVPIGGGYFGIGHKNG